MKISEDYVVELLRVIGSDWNRSEGESPLRSVEEVRRIYEDALGREALEDLGSIGWVGELLSGRRDPGEVEEGVRASEEALGRAEELVRGAFLEVLGRDPGPRPGSGEWKDAGAFGYVEQVRSGQLSVEALRVVLAESDEGRKRGDVSKSGGATVDGTSLREKGGENLLPIGVSLFYALSTGIPRDRFLAVADELRGSVGAARLSMSTLTWGNPVNEPEVVPWLPGDRAEGRGNRVDQRFLDEMEVRLDALVSRGIRPQLTLFWGGFQPLFVKNRGQRTFHDGALEVYLRAVAERLKDHPAVEVELFNEIDHGAHLGFLGLEGRREWVRKWGGLVKRLLPDHLLGLSDGGHGPVDAAGRPAGEDGTYFAYHDLDEIDFWNVHFPRDRVEAEGVPRWARGVWHLNGEFAAWRSGHDGRGGYGRNDENMFLQTEEQKRRIWNRGPNRDTTDWRMYGAQMWVALMAKAPTTIHSMSGFFCRPGAGTEPVMRVAQALRDLTRGFPLRDMASLNAGWRDSPVRSFDGPFKAFSLVSGENRRVILTTVLNPRRGEVLYDLGRVYRATVHEITGELRKETRGGPGRFSLRLPDVDYSRACVVRLEVES